MLKYITLFFATIAILFLSFCKKSGSTPPPVPEIQKIKVSVDPSVTYQEIEGFGFFGGADVWWADPNAMWNDAWGEKVISDLGISIWRNEMYPPSIPGWQNVDWSKQQPVVQGLKAKADKYKFDLKFITSVWSPPADLKWTCDFTWAGDPAAKRGPGTVSTRDGGTLNPDKYMEYADWLKSHIQLYKNEGIDLYALSLQNEPMFRQPYNSCIYTSEWYNDLVKAVVPQIKSGFPGVKVFGSENMLEMEGKEENWPYFYHNAIKNDAAASANIDMLAVHGYSDGIAPSTGSALAAMWTNHEKNISTPLNKQTWMTETSGYTDNWEKADKPGAINLALDMHAALAYGNISAWVWWQGAEASSSEFSLMTGLNGGKKYYVSKQFYRYIRPGAIRLKCSSTDPDVFTTAFKNSGKNTYTIVLINAGDKAKSVTMDGAALPASFVMYRTNATNENCTMIKEINAKDVKGFELPAKSVITLQAGGDAL